MATAAATSIQQQQQHPEEEEEDEVSWAELPSELVYMIMDKLSSSPHFMLDYIRFSSICTSWNFLYYHDNPTQLPLLMVPSSLHKNKKKKHKTKVRRFYNVCYKKLDATLQVSMPRYRHCRGSSHGWLITVDDHGWLFSVDHRENNNDAAYDVRYIRLFNPFLQGTAAGINEIVLSSLNSIPFRTSVHHYGDVKKAVLSANPTSNPTNYTVMAIYDESNRLAFFKPGNKVWTDVKLPKDLNEDPLIGYFEDVIYWRGEFHAIHHSGRIFVCEEQQGGGSGMEAKGVGQPLKIEYKQDTKNGYKQGTKKYLVVSSDGRKLMQVHRIIEHEFCSFSSESQLRAAAASARRTLYSTVGFRVFKLVTMNHLDSIFRQEGITAVEIEGVIITIADLYDWVEVKNLCGDTMFLGHNTSQSISASKHPGCKPNCIYFTDDSDFHVSISELIGPHDMGMFNLEDGSIQRHFPIYPKSTSTQPIWPVPIWIQPTIPKWRSNNATSTSPDEEEQ